MVNLFLKQEDITLKNGGYLVTSKEETPVFHQKFIDIQKEVHYLISLANKLKETDLTEKKNITFNDIVKEIKEKLNNNVRKYVTVEEKLKTPTIDKLTAESMSWINFQKETSKSEKINHLMQKYNVLAEFEEFGLYFSTDKIIKLDNIYTISDIVEAYTILEPYLD